MESSPPKSPLYTAPVSIHGMRVAISTPCYAGKFDEPYVRSLALTLPRLLGAGINYCLSTVPNESLIGKARNALVHRFLKSECTHLWFIDSDMGWNPDQVLRLFASGKDVVGAAGPRKMEEPSFCALLEHPLTVCPKTGMYKATAVGTGCIVIARRVFEHMMDCDPDNWYMDYSTKEKTYNFFDTQVHQRNFWSEDYSFCARWSSLQGEIWVDPMFTLEHVGQKTYKGALADVFKNYGNYFMPEGAIPGRIPCAQQQSA
jgi:hypothetical protein